MNDEDDAGGGTVPVSKRIAERSDGYPGQVLLHPQDHLSICGTLNYFSTYTFHLSSLWMVLVWTLTAKKAPVGANIGDEASGCSKDDDNRDSGCSCWN